MDFYNIYLIIVTHIEKKSLSDLVVIAFSCYICYSYKPQVLLK